MIRGNFLLPVLLLAGLLLSNRAFAQPTESTRLFERMVEQVTAQEEALIALRHDIHRHPEVSGEEERTAGLVAEHLTALGFDVRTGVGGHGVVAVLEGNRPGAIVAFRADMDAVPSTAEDPVEYRSVIPGVRHICGHDVHTTVGVGLAEGFAAVKDDLPGSVMLIFQPAEERGIGANAMLAEGAFDTITPEAIFALHTAPYNVGTVATVAGGMMSGRASIAVTVRGAGDLIEAASTVREAIEGVGTHPPQMAGMIAPKGFIMVNLFPQRGTAGGNIVIQGQIMAAGYEDRARAKAAVLDTLKALDLPGITLETAYNERFMEGVNNDAALVNLANSGIQALAPTVGIETVSGAVPAFSEDFGSFQARVPGVMYFLGVSNPETGTVGMPHSPTYVADDGSILVGTHAMLAAMLTRMMNN